MIACVENYGIHFKNSQWKSRFGWILLQKKVYPMWGISSSIFHFQKINIDPLKDLWIYIGSKPVIVENIYFKELQESKNRNWHFWKREWTKNIQLASHCLLLKLSNSLESLIF